ncbi:MAG: hypothetical protein P8123_01975 [bacterium]
MKLVREIRDGVVDSKVSLSAVLRKAKILAASLDNREFEQWVDCELNGYSGGIELPSYRELYSPVLGNFHGPFSSRVTGYQLPVALMPDTFKDASEAILMRHPIKEIESLASKKQDSLRHPWPAEAVLLLRDVFKLTGGYVLVEIYQPIGQEQLDGIIEAVRNRLLDFLIALEKIDPKVLDSEEALGRISSDQVSQIYNVTIHGNHNVLASGTGINQQVTQNIMPYNKSALMDYLRGLGLNTDDLQALDKAIDADGHPKEKRLGAKVTEWLGKMGAKAVDGAWKVAMGSALTRIAKALSKYYGWG